MFLFTKRTRNIIKIFWAVFATLIIISMVVTYSGFTMLAGGQRAEPREVSPDDLIAPQEPSQTEQEYLDVNSLSTSSPELQELFRSIEEDMRSGEPTQEEPTVPTQELRLEL